MKLKKLNELNEDVENANDAHFLITWNESDETHFMLVSMAHYERISEINKMLAGTYISDINDLLEEIINFGQENFFMQTYCTEDWPFGQYDIKKIISIPELGG